MVTLEKIYQAAHALKGVIRETDLIKTTGLAKDCNLYLKPENLQITGSFKVRGAYFKMSGLSPEEAAKGVVACSAGNHAQGVALAAQKRGISATIFLPAAAPISKMEATRRYGAELKLIDGVYDDAFNASLK
ncbi:MAG: pyridoxal-phosphate dependent enzyme, partial [Clostridiales bacterium]|nr:pyridoxal-phosphate dependent enzyme [Clostridiales bacterium]